MANIRTKRDTDGEWRRLHIEELNNVYRSLNIVRVIKSGRLRWAGHVARKEEGSSVFKILTGGPTGKKKKTKTHTHTHTRNFKRGEILRCPGTRIVYLWFSRMI